MSITKTPADGFKPRRTPRCTRTKWTSRTVARHERSVGWRRRYSSIETATGGTRAGSSRRSRASDEEFRRPKCRLFISKLESSGVRQNARAQTHVRPGTVQFPPRLTARGETPAAFDGRCILAGCVAPRSNTPGILGRRALPSRRLARLGATPDFHHGLYRAPRAKARGVARGRSPPDLVWR